MPGSRHQPAAVVAEQHPAPALRTHRLHDRARRKRRGRTMRQALPRSTHPNRQRSSRARIGLDSEEVVLQDSDPDGVRAA
ncbi:hypothetical protein ACL02U_13245 [Streptomyces sp. MS06]|uniref:hypothetical protein n=1 Tax=Streptomyces sp. MS06 TaxID=3385974 RepID=UPI00399F849E